jgi:DNA-binding NtrC family response regulator
MLTEYPGTPVAILNLNIMKNILLCSSNPILVKSLYGVLREEGYAVDIVEHPALAVQQVMNGAYDMMIVDSEPFGLSAEDAVQIIRSVLPGMPVLFVGSSGGCASERAVETPVDLEEFKRTVHSIAV